MIKSVVLALAAVAGTLGAGAAQAGGISWSIGISTPMVGTVISNAPGYYSPGYHSPGYGSSYHGGAYYAPAPVYDYSPPVYVYAPPAYAKVPAPVYRSAPVPRRFHLPYQDGHYRPAPVLHPREAAPRWHREHRHHDQRDHRERRYD